jgi:transcription elongation factor Elf1
MERPKLATPLKIEINCPRCHDYSWRETVTYESTMFVKNCPMCGTKLRAFVNTLQQQVVYELDNNQFAPKVTPLTTIANPKNA